MYLQVDQPSGHLGKRAVQVRQRQQERLNLRRAQRTAESGTTSRSRNTARLDRHRSLLSLKLIDAPASTGARASGPFVQVQQWTTHLRGTTLGRIQD
jgi:hypothetical protein